jgi:ATP-dependent Clp protease ATP-binding subunit ClpA
MLELWTDRAMRAVVLARQEARMLNHDYIGTEHILLGLIGEGDGAAAKALESLGISLDAVRQQVEGITGRGLQPPSKPIQTTARATKVLELSVREALPLGHTYIDTEHILLSLIREGDGAAAQVLVNLGADLNRVRQQVTQMVHGYQRKEPTRDGTATPWLSSLPAVATFLKAVEQQLAAVERRDGIGTEMSDLDEEIRIARGMKEAALARENYELAIWLGGQEIELLASKAARQPELSVLVERCQQFAEEIERLGAALRQHSTDPQNKPP